MSKNIVRLGIVFGLLITFCVWHAWKVEKEVDNCKPNFELQVCE